MPSSIVDLTGAVPRLLRAGAISETRLREVCGVLLSDQDEPPAPATDAESDAEPESGTDAPRSPPRTPNPSRTPNGRGAGLGTDVKRRGAKPDEDVKPEAGSKPSETSSGATNGTSPQ